MLLCSSLIELNRRIENYFWTKASLGDRCTVGPSILISCPIVISFLIQIKFDFLRLNCIITIITLERVYPGCIPFALSPYRDNANREFSIWIIIFFLILELYLTPEIVPTAIVHRNQNLITEKELVTLHDATPFVCTTPACTHFFNHVTSLCGLNCDQQSDMTIFWLDDRYRLAVVCLQFTKMCRLSCECLPFAKWDCLLGYAGHLMLNLAVKNQSRPFSGANSG